MYWPGHPLDFSHRGRNNSDGALADGSLARSSSYPVAYTVLNITAALNGAA